MLGNKSRDTGPELAVRRLLHAQGLRYRLNGHPLEGVRRTADIVFPGKRVAVFIDGCYWHGCPEHYTAPKANAEFWRDKVLRNQQRDQDTNARLTAAGWRVLRFWAHEPADVVALRIAAVVRDRDGCAPVEHLSRAPAGLSGDRIQPADPERLDDRVAHCSANEEMEIMSVPSDPT